MFSKICSVHLLKIKRRLTKRRICIFYYSMSFNVVVNVGRSANLNKLGWRQKNEKYIQFFIFFWIFIFTIMFDVINEEFLTIIWTKYYPSLKGDVHTFGDAKILQIACHSPNYATNCDAEPTERHETLLITAPDFPDYPLFQGKI